MTLYGAIVFSIGYWACYEWWRALPDPVTTVQSELARIEAAKLSSVKTLDDESLWKMSRTPAFVEAGRAAFTANCVSCHLASLRGKAENPTAIGASLIGTKWITGGHPLDLISTVSKGTARGMPAWGPVLGARRITEVVAYVLSYHQPGEPIEIVASLAAGVK
jgi:cytochrome c oxidase cbb3-type subunit 3